VSTHFKKPVCNCSLY